MKGVASGCEHEEGDQDGHVAERPRVRGAVAPGVAQRRHAAEDVGGEGRHQQERHQRGQRDEGRFEGDET